MNLSNKTVNDKDVNSTGSFKLFSSAEISKMCLNSHKADNSKRTKTLKSEKGVEKSQADLLECEKSLLKTRSSCKNDYYNKVLDTNFDLYTNRGIGNFPKAYSSCSPPIKKDFSEYKSETYYTPFTETRGLKVRRFTFEDFAELDNFTANFKQEEQVNKQICKRLFKRLGAKKKLAKSPIASSKSRKSKPEHKIKENPIPFVNRPNTNDIIIENILSNETFESLLTAFNQENGKGGYNKNSNPSKKVTTLKKQNSGKKSKTINHVLNLNLFNNFVVTYQEADQFTIDRLKAKEVKEEEFKRNLNEFVGRKKKTVGSELTNIKPNKKRRLYLPEKHPQNKTENKEETVNVVGCKCYKTKCIKSYCICFANGKSCGKFCHCENCSNQCFDNVPRKKKSLKRGCNCETSNCQKKYCECFKNGNFCGIYCKCLSCKNLKSFYGLKITACAKELNDELPKIRSSLFDLERQITDRETELVSGLN